MINFWNAHELRFLRMLSSGQVSGSRYLMFK
jgi:hypothetical protein